MSRHLILCLRLAPLASFVLAILLATSLTRGGIASTGLSPCIQISPTGRSYNADLHTDSVQVVANPGVCDWLITSVPQWIIVTRPLVGSGSGTISFIVQSNSAGVPNANTPFREGTLVVHDFFGSGDVNFSAIQQGCTFSIGSSSAVVPQNAGSFTIPVLTGSVIACPWTASTATPWISVTTPKGSGDGTAGYTVTANPIGSIRSGTISVAGQTFTVTQAAGPCTYQLSPANRSVGPESATGTITVMAPTACTWTASSMADWITITSNPAGSGNGTLNYLASANTTGATRSGTITVADQTFTLTQSGATCSYSVMPPGSAYPAGGGSGSFTIMAPDLCTWLPSSNADWITITSGGAGGLGRGRIAYTVAANPGPGARKGAITIANQTFTVGQAAPADKADLSVVVMASPNPVASGTRLSYTIVVTNAGPNQATGVTVVTATPTGTTFDSFDGPGSATPPSAGGTGPVSLFIPSIPATQSDTFTLNVDVVGASGSSLLESATVSSLTADPVPGNNSAMAMTQILGGGVVELAWDQTPSTAADPTPPPTNVRVETAPSATTNESPSRRGESPASDACLLTGYNVYLSTSTPVQTVPANLWLSLPPTNTTPAPVAPGGTFYAVTSLWNCGGTIIESGLTGTSGSNQTNVPAPPNITGVRVGGKMRAIGGGFTDTVEVFVDGVAFARPAVVNNNTVVVQKGPLVDGRSLSDLLSGGKTVLISFRNSNGGIGSFSYTQQ